MKNALFPLLILFLLQTFCYAAFPVKVKDANDKSHVEIAELGESVGSILEDQAHDDDLMWSGRRGSGFGVASLVCGVLGVLLFPFMILLGPCAVVFGAIGLNRELNGLAIAGLCLGLLGISLLSFIFSGSLMIMA